MCGLGAPLKAGGEPVSLPGLTKWEQAPIQECGHTWGKMPLKTDPELTSVKGTMSQELDRGKQRANKGPRATV